MGQQVGVPVRQMIAAIGFVAVAIVSTGGQTPAPGGTTERTGAQPGTRTATAQGQGGWVPPRLPDGQPDMQGTYIPNWPSTVPIEKWTAAELKEHADLLVRMRGKNPGAGAGGGESDLQGEKPPPGTAMVVDPPDGRIPYQPWAAAKRKYMREHLYDREEFVSTRTRCFPPGIRDMNIGSNYTGWQIVQAPGLVVILHEWHHLYRTIRLDGRPHVGPRIQLWMGDSRGKWEGNTLVVDASNFTDKTWVVGEIDGEGPSCCAFHSPALHATERFTIVDADYIDYEATFEDPNVFTQPWTIKRKLWKRAPKDYVLFEYACHEGNIGWQNMKEGFKQRAGNKAK
jgi:hypothetical protein